MSGTSVVNANADRFGPGRWVAGGLSLCIFWVFLMCMWSGLAVVVHSTLFYEASSNVFVPVYTRCEFFFPCFQTAVVPLDLYTRRMVFLITGTCENLSVRLLPKMAVKRYNRHGSFYACLTVENQLERPTNKYGSHRERATFSPTV